jgi:hypothetical protein
MVREKMKQSKSRALIFIYSPGGGVRSEGAPWRAVAGARGVQRGGAARFKFENDRVMSPGAIDCCPGDDRE